MIRIADALGAGKDSFDARTVPCRECGAPVEISGFVVGLAVMASNHCRNRGWEPLRPNEITACSDCRAEIEAVWQARCAQAHRILGEISRAAKDGRSFQAILFESPTWFRDEYQHAVNEIAARAEARKNAKPETARRGIR